MQSSDQLQRRVGELNEQLENRLTEIKSLRDAVKDAEVARKNGEKSIARDQSAWDALRRDLEEKVALEREKTLQLEKRLAEEALVLKDLQQSIDVAKRERDILSHAGDGLRGKSSELEQALRQRDLELTQAREQFEYPLHVV